MPWCEMTVGSERHQRGANQWRSMTRAVGAIPTIGLCSASCVAGRWPVSAARNALPAHYQRPTEALLDHLVTLGTQDVRDDEENQGTTDASDTSDTAGTDGISCTLDNGGDSGTSDTSVTRSTTGVRPPPEPRDHVKLRRSLADEMRDAVWFLSEHGRPRVQLGELLDEAVAAWLAQIKAHHNGGADFPRRGRLR